MQRLRLILILLVILVLSLATPLISRFAVRPQLMTGLEDECREATSSLGQHLHASHFIEENLFPPVMDGKDWDTELQTLKEDFNLLRIQILSPQGQVIYSTHRADIGAQTVYPLTAIVENRKTTARWLDGSTAHGGPLSEAAIDALTPLVRKGEVRAILALRHDVTRAAHRIEEVTRNLSRVSGLLALCLGATAVWFGWRSEHQRWTLVSTEQDLARTSDLVRALGDASPNPLFIKDRDGYYLECNKPFEAFVGLARERILGRTASDILPPQRAQIYQDNDNDLYRTGGVQHYGSVVEDSRGEERKVNFCKATFYDTGDEPVGLVGMIEDQTDREATEERLRYLQYYDRLTGLPNRVLFFDRIQQALEQARVEGTMVALLLLDIDRLKGINDHFGEEVGDDLLHAVAARMRLLASPKDSIGRLGGDEFGLLMTGLSTLQTVGRLAEELLGAVDSHRITDSEKMYLSASVGISLFPTDSNDSTTLHAHAETAMESAKNQGRNCYRFFTHQVDRRAQDRRVLENGLRRALEEEQFFLDFQPQVDLQTGRILGVEALLRWAHPDRGLVPPDEFIPIAEESGLIRPLGVWVLRAACQQLEIWRKKGLPQIKMAVNISNRQLDDPDLIDQIDEILASTGVLPTHLELELTESVVMRDAEKNITSLIDFKTRGIDLTIDDFGTGYSSLSYLKHLPIDGLKIDRSFVHDLGLDNDSAAIVDAILALAMSLGLRVTVEGIENEHQLQHFNGISGLVAQGFLFSRPTSGDGIARLLQEGSLITLPDAG